MSHEPAESTEPLPDSSAPGAVPSPAADASPYADPNYGRDAERGDHVIHSKPRWAMEENQSSLTGWVGAGVILAGGVVTAAYFNQRPRLPDGFMEALPSVGPVLDNMCEWLWTWRHPVLVMLVFFGMFFVETMIFKTHRRHFDFERPRTLDGEAWKRIVLRWIATAFCVGVATFLYCVLNEYSFHKYVYGLLAEGKTINQLKNHYYARYIQFFVVSMPVLLVVCIPYYWLVERYARHDGPVDEFLVLGHTLRRIACWLSVGVFNGDARADARSAVANPHIANLARGLLVKFFYVPLMLMWTLNVWSDWESSSHAFLLRSSQSDLSNPTELANTVLAFHHMFFTMLILLDLGCALAGYCLSMRLLDTHITTAEPTLLGWAVALACYPPFNNNITHVYFPYDTPGVIVWQEVLRGDPFLLILASVVILGLMSIYTWGTIVFGLRFSNLTNRGIVCSGPYRYIRHPAYICKNLSWWIEYMPFLAPTPMEGAIKTLRLIAANSIYGLRAYTEERHLMRELHYREYCRKVPWRFIPGIF